MRQYVQHVAYQSSGNGTSSHGPSSMLSFAASGLQVARGSAANSSTSAVLAALRSAQLKSLCMNKTSHRGTIQFAASSKNNQKVRHATKYQAPLASDRTADLSFCILVGRAITRCSAANSHLSFFERCRSIKLCGRRSWPVRAAQRSSAPRAVPPCRAAHGGSDRC